MSREAGLFIKSNYERILNTISAVSGQYTCWNEEDFSPIETITHCFLIPYLLYIDEYCDSCSDETTRFALEVVSYLDHRFANEIESLIANDCLLQKWIEDRILEYKSEGIYNLKYLSERISFVLACCIKNDSQENGDTFRQFYETLQDYASILINSERIQVSEDDLRFYRDFNRCLASLNMRLSTNGRGSEKDELAIIIEESLTRLSPNHGNSISLDLIGNASTRKPSLPTDSRENTPIADEPNQDATLEQIIREINSLIGLENIKREVSDLLNLLKVQQMRMRSGFSSLGISKHMVFYGNPGTGKTTIARKLAVVYKVLGILSKGHLIEADRSTLVAGYLGQTAIKTKEILEDAKGGILFIDEAYSLSQNGEQDQYGQEAIDTILKFMEDNRDDLIIVVAGYEGKMGEFLDSNPGLKSRFNKYFYFSDYSAPELAEIFVEMAAKSQYQITPPFRQLLDLLCHAMVLRKTENFGNGRTIRNLFEKCVSNQANRIVTIPSPSTEQLVELLESDLSMKDLDLVMR